MTSRPTMLFPGCLDTGDKVAIVSPASSVRTEYIEGAADCLRALGFEPEVWPHACGPAEGSYAAPLHCRALDLLGAWESDARAILCGRGGYGCVHLLPYLSPAMLRSCPRWLIGFSDVSALHAALQQAGVASLHASMARHLATGGPSHEVTRHIVDILTTRADKTYTAPPYAGNIEGQACGRLRGGNLAVLNGLASTPYDIMPMEDTILFIEDVAEPIYKVERVLWRLRMAGYFDSLNPASFRGLITGRFTGYEPSRDHESMESMIAAFLEDAGIDIPVAMGFDIGHIERNLPLVEGVESTLCVDASGASLTMHLSRC